MLTALSIRDMLLIERLDLSFGPGLTVLTGETGAGKSILLDGLGLAIGGRGEAGLVRPGGEQAVVSARFQPAADHPVLDLLHELGLPSEAELILRRVVGQDGRSRAFVNEAPAGIALLRRLGALLVEVQGQHEQIGLADPSTHRDLLDAFGGAEARRRATQAAWAERRAAAQRFVAAREAIAAAERDRDWLTHVVQELSALAPEADEEQRLADERQHLQGAERRSAAIEAARAELGPRDRRSPGPAAFVRAALRTLQRLAPSPAGADEASNPIAAAVGALERAEESLAEAEQELARLADLAEADPRRLEAAEERLFALRGAARKHSVSVADLPDLLTSLRLRLETLETGVAQLDVLAREAKAAHAAFVAAATALSQLRQEAARRLERAVARELPPLRLDKARFAIAVATLDEAGWSEHGIDAVAFLLATNPGQSPGPLARVASGGELSRLMLALKVVLSTASPVPTLIFDEVDSGIGGATAAAVGERLARVAGQLQVLVVTHSPQVAARGAAHLRVAKRTARGRAATTVEALDAGGRQEEIARMLAGETITEAARAAAADLLGTPA